MNKYLLLTLFCFLHFIVAAQQLPLFTNYLDNATLINPASINTDFFTRDIKNSLSATYRRQWVGLENAPCTQNIKFDYNSSDRNMNFLAGGYLINDKTGPTGFTGIYGKYGIILSDRVEDYGFSIALNAGFVQYRLKTSELKLRDGDDIIASNDRTQYYPDAGIGIQYYNTFGGRSNDKFFAGLSIPQLLGLNFDVSDTKGNYSIQRVQHFYGNFGMIKNIGDESFLQPMAWIKYVPGAPVNVDLNLRYQFNRVFWMTLGGSTAKVMHLDAGVSIFKDYNSPYLFKIGYGYDYYYENYSSYIGSSHEIVLSMGF
jgi:type IX secretion system PorP/SprF family membrane protein